MSHERRRKDRNKARAFKGWISRRAEEMRSTPTEAEAVLVDALRRAGATRFETQRPMGCFILDIHFPAVGLVVEVDGNHHIYNRAQKRKDWKRTKCLMNSRRVVMRYANSEIMDPERLPQVVEEIRRVVMTLPLVNDSRRDPKRMFALSEATAKWSAEDGTKEMDAHFGSIM